MNIKSKILSDEMRILSGANIVNLDNNNAVASDANGNFSISVDFPDTKLKISHVGYKTQVIPANQIGSYVELPTVAEELEEITITANPKTSNSSSKNWGLILLGGAAAMLVMYKVLSNSKPKTTASTKQRIRTIKA